MNETRDKLIELITHAPRLDFSVGGRAYSKTYHMAESLADHLIANGVTVGDANNATTTWISVEERLPTASGEYLTIQKFGINSFYEVCRYAISLAVVDEEQFNDVAGWYTCEEWGYCSNHHVTHWMPLPEAPKGEEE